MSSRLKMPRMIGSTLLAAFVCGSACVETVARGEDGVQAVQFKDMVVPAGLRLLDDSHQSHSVETSGWRQGRFVYSGLVQPAEAASYVRERMPLHNWELVKDETTAVEPVTTTMRFLRGYYVAEYRFTRVDGRTQLVVDYDTDYTSR